MGDATGSVSVSANNNVEGSSDEVCKTCNYPASDTAGLLGLSRDTWVKVALWLVPIIFASGAAYVSIANAEKRIKSNEQVIKTFGEKQNEMYTFQKVQDAKLDGIKEAQDAKLQVIKESQGALKQEIKGVKDRLDDQTNDLTLIKAKLGVRTVVVERRQDGD